MERTGGGEKVAEFPSVCETRPVLCQNMAPRVNTSIRDDCKPSLCRCLLRHSYLLSVYRGYGPCFVLGDYWSYPAMY